MRMEELTSCIDNIHDKYWSPWFAWVDFTTTQDYLKIQYKVATAGHLTDTWASLTTSLLSPRLLLPLILNLLLFSFSALFYLPLKP